MAIEEGIELGIRAINAAIQRDLASGDGVAVAIIDSSGYKELSKKEIEGIMGKVKNK